MTQTKCHQYWPDKVSKYGVVKVLLDKVEVFADFTIRTFILTKVKGNTLVIYLLNS